ncbi:unnamed protein product [Strongylus vulgaris]|uniref:Uncharacterized protein n=1 Tax=Strongylus vulgaris TaxID=40348 RepID=A0A3P7KV35_STRVU|nr:unnamed protein product [Strongylus vulgaris]
MLKCLRMASLLDDTDPRLHVCRVKFLKYKEAARFSEVIGGLVEEMSSQLFTEMDPMVLNDSFKHQHLNSLRHRIAVAECNLVLDPGSESTTKNWLIKSLEDEKLVGRNLKTVVELYDSIKYGRHGTWSKEEVSIHQTIRFL